MVINEGWAQVATIVIANLSMFLWATRQARSDYIHMDKKFEDNRREMNAIWDRHLQRTDRILAKRKNIKC